jgi:hypothetical protein
MPEGWVGEYQKPIILTLAYNPAATVLSLFCPSAAIDLTADSNGFLLSLSGTGHLWAAL